MNMIDAIIVEDAISGAMLEGGIEKLRTGILSVYNGAQVSSSTAQQMPGHTVKPAHTYMQMNDEGLLGFEAPLE